MNTRSNRRNVPDGLLGLRYHLQQPQNRRGFGLDRLIGAGNYVVTLGGYPSPDARARVFDIYRLAGGLIVERWDVSVTNVDACHGPECRPTG